MRGCEEGVEARIGNTGKTADKEGDRSRPTLWAGCIFAAIVGFRLGHTTSMAIAKILDPDKNAFRRNDSIKTRLALGSVLRQLRGFVLVRQQCVYAVPLCLEGNEFVAVEHPAVRQTDSHGIDLGAVDHNLVMQVRPGRQAG